MQRHKIVAQIILLILSVINFAPAAPLVRGIRGVRVDVVYVAEDVTTASRKHLKNKWWTDAADGTNMPPSLGSSGSNYRSEQELRPHDPRSPMDSNAPPQPSLGSADSGNSHPLPVGSPAAAHNNLPLDIDLNASPLQEPTDSDNSHPLPVGSPPPAHNNLPLDIDLNASPQPSQELTDGSDYGSYLTGSSTDDYDSADSSINGQVHGSHSTSLSTQNSFVHPTGSESSSDVMSPWAWWVISKSPSSSPSSDFNPLPRPGNLDIDLNRPLSSPGPTDDQPPPPPSDPGSSKRPYRPLDDWDSGPSKRPYRPSDPGPSTWAHPPSDPAPSPSTRPYSPSDSVPSTWAHPPPDPRPSTSDPGPSTRPYPPLDPTPLPLSSLGPLQHDSETGFSELFRGRFKRRISGSRSVNAAKRVLQCTVESRDSTIKGCDKIRNAPPTSAIRRVIPRCARTSSRSLPGPSKVEGDQNPLVLLV